MKGLLFSLLLLSVALFSFESPAEGQKLDSREVYVIPFSHLDLFWACTEEECLSRGDFIISKAIQLAKQYPQFRYLLETEVFVAHFVENHRGTKELEDFTQLVKEGRIEIGPLWAAIYQNQTRGEALVRNVVYGKRYARDVFGVDPQVAHLADIPGFTRQYPQILKKSGVPYMVMTRMGPRDSSLFHWKAPDGSEALVWNTINGYGWGVGLGLHLDLDQDHLKAVGNDVQSVGATTDGPVYLGWGTDLYAPNSKLIENISALNRHFSKLHFQLSTAEEFFHAAAGSHRIPTLSGEIPSSWANLTTSLVPLWLPAMSATDTLVTAEKFAAVNYAQRYAPYPGDAFEALWKENLESLDHNNDGQGGKIGDERKLGYAQQAVLGASQILRASLANIAERVQSPFSRSTPIVVFNPLNWDRDDVVETHLTLFGEVAAPDIDDYKRGMSLFDENGLSVPFQVEQTTDGSSRSLDLVFVAQRVPSVGYKTYYLVPADHQETFPNSCKVKLETDFDAKQANETVGVDLIENEYYRVTIERATGRVDVFDKELNRVVSKGLEISGAEEQGGDDQNIIVRTGRTIVNVIHSVELEENGPVRTIVNIEGVVGSTPVIQRLVLYSGLKKIDMQNTIAWKPGPSISIAQLFPIPQPNAEVRNGIPYGTVTAADIMTSAGPSRDDEVAPDIWKRWRQIQDWVWVGQADGGITISADHNLIEVENGTLQADMLRGTRFSPATTIKDGRQVLDTRPPAAPYVFKYSITSGKGDWSEARSWRAGMQFCAPLIPVTSSNPLGEKSLPPAKSFLSLGADNLVLAAMKKSDTGDGIVLRTFEIEGHATESRISFLGKDQPFRRANLLEEDVLASEQTSLHVQPYEIDTVKLAVH